MAIALESMLLTNRRQLPPSEGAISKPLVQCLAGSYNLVIVCWSGIFLWSYIFQTAVLPQMSLRQSFEILRFFFFPQQSLLLCSFQSFTTFLEYFILMSFLSLPVL